MNLIWIFIYLTIKNSYLIYVLLKNSKKDFQYFFTIYYTLLDKFIKKYKN